jgi:hypothetical protein
LSISCRCLQSTAEGQVFLSRPWPLAVPFEELHGALMLLGRRARLEGAEVPALAGFWILLSGVESVFPGLELADHSSLARKTISNGLTCERLPANRRVLEHNYNCNCNCNCNVKSEERTIERMKRMQRISSLCR